VEIKQGEIPAKRQHQSLLPSYARRKESKCKDFLVLPGIVISVVYKLPCIYTLPSASHEGWPEKFKEIFMLLWEGFWGLILLKYQSLRKWYLILC